MVRIGLLGYGFMGKCHSHAYRTIGHIYSQTGVRPQLKALCDQDEPRAREAAARFGYERHLTDWRALAADPEIDVFDNCGPDPLHPEPCIAALKNGKHVICEKPMAIALADAQRMAETARGAKGKAVCVFNYRFMPAVRLARELIASGRIGRIYQIRVQYLQMCGHDPSLKPEQLWYAAWPASGVMQGIGSHAIDQCRYLVGEIKSVSALVGTTQPERARPSAGDPDVFSDELSAALLEFDNGAIGVLEASDVAPGHRNDLRWEIHGAQGSLRWSLEHPNSLYACFAGGGGAGLLGYTEISATEPEHPGTGPWWPPGHNLGWEHSHIIEKFSFLDAIANGKPLDPAQATFEDGYRTALIIHAMRESSREGKKVNVSYVTAG